MYISIAQTAAGTAGNGTYLIALPTGTVNNTVIRYGAEANGNAGTIVGEFFCSADGARNCNGVVKCFDSTHIYCEYNEVYTTPTYLYKETWDSSSIARFSFKNTMNFSIHCIIPL
jgi:hypothetical protein